MSKATPNAVIIAGSAVYRARIETLDEVREMIKKLHFEKPFGDQESIQRIFQGLEIKLRGTEQSLENFIDLGKA